MENKQVEMGGNRKLKKKESCHESLETHLRSTGVFDLTQQDGPAASAACYNAHLR